MLVDVARDEKGRAGFSVHSLEIPLGLADKANASNNSIVCNREDLALSLEVYLRKMIAKCAVSVYVPYKQDSGWLSQCSCRAANTS